MNERAPTHCVGARLVFGSTCGSNGPGAPNRTVRSAPLVVPSPLRSVGPDMPQDPSMTARSAPLTTPSPFRSAGMLGTTIVSVPLPVSPGYPGPESNQVCPTLDHAECHARRVAAAEFVLVVASDHRAEATTVVGDQPRVEIGSTARRCHRLGRLPKQPMNTRCRHGAGSRRRTGMPMSRGASLSVAPKVLNRVGTVEDVHRSITFVVGRWLDARSFTYLDEVNS